MSDDNFDPVKDRRTALVALWRCLLPAGSERLVNRHVKVLQAK